MADIYEAYLRLNTGDGESDVVFLKNGVAESRTPLPWFRNWNLAVDVFPPRLPFSEIGDVMSSPSPFKARKVDGNSEIFKADFFVHFNHASGVATATLPPAGQVVGQAFIIAARGGGDVLIAPVAPATFPAGNPTVPSLQVVAVRVIGNAEEGYAWEVAGSTEVPAPYVAWNKAGDNGASGVHNFGSADEVIVPQPTDESHAARFGLARIGASTYFSIQHLQDVFHSTGWITGGEITSNGDGTVDVAAGSGLIRAANSPLAEIKYFNWAAVENLSMTDGSINYIYARYNGGAPDVVAATSAPSDYQTNVILGKAFRVGTAVHIFREEVDLVGDHAKQMVRFNRAIMPFAHESGAMLSAIGSRNIAISAGAFWHGLMRFITPTFDSSVADTFTVWYHLSSEPTGWFSVSAQTQINNTQYDDGDGLSTLTAGRYGVRWVYLESDGHVDVVIDQGNYILSDALSAESPSSLPVIISSTARLIGKIIILKDASSFYSIESAFKETFSPAGIVNIADLAGTAAITQGGTGATTAAAALENLLAASRADGIVGSGSAGVTFAALPNGWYKAVITHAAFTDLDDSQTVDIADIPAGVEIQGAWFYLDVNFSGGGIVTFQVDIIDSVSGVTYIGYPNNVNAGAPAVLQKLNAETDGQAFGSASYFSIHSSPYKIQIVGTCDVAHDVADATAGQVTLLFKPVKESA